MAPLNERRLKDTPKKNKKNPLTNKTEYGTIKTTKKEKEMFTMTKKEMFVAIKAMVAENEEMVAFIDHEIELLSKKRSDNSKAKAESDARAEKVFTALSEMDKPVTISELIALTSDEEVKGYTNQRVSALMRKLGDRVVKTMVKGKAYFYCA